MNKFNPRVFHNVFYHPTAYELNRILKRATTTVLILEPSSPTTVIRKFFTNAKTVSDKQFVITSRRMWTYCDSAKESLVKTDNAIVLLVSDGGLTINLSRSM